MQISTFYSRLTNISNTYTNKTLSPNTLTNLRYDLEDLLTEYSDFFKHIGIYDFEVDPIKYMDNTHLNLGDFIYISYYTDLILLHQDVRFLSRMKINQFLRKYITVANSRSYNISTILK